MSDVKVGIAASTAITASATTAATKSPGAAVAASTTPTTNKNYMMNGNVFECSLRWEAAEVSSFICLEGIFFQSLIVQNTDEIQLYCNYS